MSNVAKIASKLLDKGYTDLALQLLAGGNYCTFYRRDTETCNKDGRTCPYDEDWKECPKLKVGDTKRAELEITVRVTKNAPEDWVAEILSPKDVAFEDIAKGISGHDALKSMADQWAKSGFAE